MEDTLFDPGDKVKEVSNMSLDLIADQIKALKSGEIFSLNAYSHDILLILESMRIVLQQHEAILLYRFGTLDLEYHRRRDEIYQKYFKDPVEEDEHKEFLTPEEALTRVDRFSRETNEAWAKLKEEFNL